MAAKDQVTGQFQFTIGQQRVAAKFTVSQGPTSPRELIPIMQAMTDLVVSVAVEGEAQAGRTISCAAGCGACCRQVVPIAPTEARQIADLIDGLPEPRRSEIRERFAAAVERLTKARLIDELRHPERVGDEQVIPFGLAYFQLGIACPFLEEESCSIHADRPLACREHLVTSPPAHCAQPELGAVQGVHLNAKVSRVVRQMDRQARGATASWVPLILAPEWVANHPDEPSPRPGPELLQEFIERLTAQKLPETATETGFET